MIKAVAHVCIKTSDLGPDGAVYSGALGLAKVFNFSSAASQPWNSNDLFSREASAVQSPPFESNR